jgi:AcrR family transcriptional regulator
VAQARGRSPQRSDGRQARWEEHNRGRRQAIIDAYVAVLEDHEPGATVHVQQIAERAGIGRSVLYRHFADREDLDLAVRTAIVDTLADQLLPAVSLEGTVPDIIERVIARYVSWAVAHPSLHRLVESDPMTSSAPLQHTLERIAAKVAEVVTAVLDLLDVELRPEQRQAVDPLASGVVGAVFSAVRRWLSADERQPSAPVLVSVLTDPVQELFDDALRVDSSPD